jgi:WD40-like Beta Propeller Repeat
MKNGAYFVKQKTRTQGWAPPGRLSGLCTLALGLALTRILSTQAAGFNVDPDVFGVVTELVSINQAGTDSVNGGAGLDGLSADGRFVGFVSDATDLVATDDTNGEFDVFVRDLKTGTTTLVSVNRAGTDSGNGRSAAGFSFSADGRFVAFASEASDLVATDTNGQGDVFVRDLKTGTTTL